MAGFGTFQIFKPDDIVYWAYHIGEGEWIPYYGADYLSTMEKSMKEPFFNPSNVKEGQITDFRVYSNKVTEPAYDISLEFKVAEIGGYVS